MLSDSDYVVSLYQCLLGRDPDGTGLELYCSLLKNRSIDRRTLLQHVLDSHEFSQLGGAGERGAIPQAFSMAYGRPPSPAEATHCASLVGRMGAKGGQKYLRAITRGLSKFSYPTPITVRFIEDDLVLSDISGTDKRLTLDVFDISVSENIIKHGKYEEHISSVLPLLVSSGDVAVDVGANVGFHTLTLSELVGSKGKVYAFEPNTENVRLLLLTKAREKLDNVEILPFALSDSIGAATFSTAIGSNGNFLPNNEATLVHPNCIVVPTVLMDTLFSGSKINFIKIDIEGAEYKALKGARKTIERFKPTIISEFSMEMLARVSGVQGGDYMKFMLGMGYQAITLGVSGPIAAFTEVAPFVEAWGHPLRIEDILFIDPARGIGASDIERIARTARTTP